ncbi:MAG: hypothetical protein HZB51_23280 [Chloroflexi bacterium]|nr:hypothetical protein [Chloroflexota bacterium]
MPENDQLSERERELLELVATGASNKEIAQKLFISTNTVKVHLRNIFAKTGVSSRTEATLYAIQHGMVAINNAVTDKTAIASASDVASDQDTIEPTMVESQYPSPALALETTSSLLKPSVVAVPHTKSLNSIWIIALLVIVAITIGSIALFVRQSPTIVSASPAAPTMQTASTRWQPRNRMPTSRASAATANYENKIYVIGGETDETTISTTQSYDPIQDTWTTLQPKPVAVTDISAAIVAGKIYVPGGKLADSSVTSICEVYDPQENVWSQAASLPIALSGYALTPFEGKLYLFGGYDGKNYVNTVYMYDPSRDQWSERTRIPTARALAGVAIAGGKIYVIGGFDGNNALATVEQYLPERDNGKDTPWLRISPMPDGRYAMGIASIADIIHIVGGIGNSSKPPTPIEYLYQQDKWQDFDAPPTLNSWSNLNLIPIESYLYAIGGKSDGKLLDTNLAYRAIYTVIVPAFK